MNNESGTIFKLILLLGAVFMLIAALNPGSEAEWINFSSSMQNFPQFNSPFDRQITRGIAFPDEPSFSNGDNSSKYVGCDNTSIGRPNCVNTNDGEKSYFLLTIGAIDEGIFDFNWSKVEFQGLSGSTIRRIVSTVSCKTIEGPAFKFLLFWAKQESATPQTCPVSDTYRDVTFDVNLPTGSGGPFPFTPYPQATLMYDDANGSNDPSSKARVTFVQIEVYIVEASATCKAPDGAWFPAIDEIACQIAQFGGLIFKFFEFIANGIIFLGQIIIWFFGLIGSFIALFATFFALPGAPPIVQGIVTVLFVAIIAYIGFVMLSRIRGSGMQG